MNRSQAKTQLEALLAAKGVLRIITNEHACGGGKHPTILPFNQTKCDAYEHTVYSPQHFVLHDVVEIKPYPAKAGVIQAFSKEGDWTMGYPEDVLRRLLQHSQG